MSQFTNDMGRPLTAPCPVGIFGKECTEQVYQSWRRVAVGLRATMLAAAWSQATNDLHKDTLVWLKKWIDTSLIDNPIEMGQEITKTISEADPIVTQGQRFPSELAFYQGTWSPVGLSADWTYNERTEILAHYIRQGKILYDMAVRARVVTKKSTEIRLAEETKPEKTNWLPLAVGVGGIFAVAGFVIWGYTSVLRAMRSGRKRNA